VINKVFVTGGIGTGILFKFREDAPLERNESRAAYLTDYRDYCKGHIILHYIAVLSPGVEAYMIGKIGDDARGEELLREMEAAGIDARHVERTAYAPTMHSTCFIYPDGAGGNITASNSACSLVTPEFIENHSREIDCESLVVAAPEVPFESRVRLLEIGRERGAFNAASFTAAEVFENKFIDLISLSDFISINRDEARAFCDGTPEEAATKMKLINPSLKLAITSGGDGVYLFENERSLHIPAVEAEVVSTAGAGDAFLAGAAAGFIKGKDFFTSAKYGCAAAFLSVQSGHTIADNVTIENLKTAINIII